MQLRRAHIMPGSCTIVLASGRDDVFLTLRSFHACANVFSAMNSRPWLRLKAIQAAVPVDRRRPARSACHADSAGLHFGGVQVTDHDWLYVAESGLHMLHLPSAGLAGARQAGCGHLACP